MTEVWKDAKNTIKGIASIISPSRTRTDNRYSPIGPNEDDNRSTGSNGPNEDENRSTGSNDNKSNNNESESEHESDTDSDYGTMTKPEAKTIKDLVKDTSVIRPKQFPSLMDVFDFKNEVINALTLCDLRGNVQGHAFILENNEEYNTRNQTVTETHPAPPLPVDTPGAGATSREWKIFDREEAAYDLYTNYNKQVVALIDTAFPGALEPLYVMGHLSPATLAVTAINTVTNSVKDNIATEDTIQELLEAQPKRKYIPNSNGPRDYFKECEFDARMAERLGQPIDIKTTILHARNAFKVAHPESIVEIRKLLNEWNAIKRTTQTQYKTRYDAAVTAKTVPIPPKQPSPDAIYILFKAHYSEKIKEMYTDNNTKHKANQAQEQLGHRLDGVDHRFGGVEEGLSDLALALKSVAADRNTIPKMIGTPTGSLAESTLASNPVIQSMMASQKALSAQMQTMMNNMAQTSQSNPQGGQPDKRTGYRGRFRDAVSKICRQYKFWCWSCGVNLSHDGCNCGTPKPGHIKEATKDNPQGGNISKNARFMMFRHPTSGATIDHCVVI